MSDLLIPTAVYETYFMSKLHSYMGQSYKIDVGTFSKKSFALEFAANKLKKSIVRIHKELPIFTKYNDPSYQGYSKVKELKNFLKETYNSLKEDMSHEEINDIIYKVSTEIKQKIATKEFSYFSVEKCTPFLHLFDVRENYFSPEKFVLFIEEKLIDQVPEENSGEELPDKL